MGRTLQGGAKGPGLFFIVPCIGNYFCYTFENEVM